MTSFIQFTDFDQQVTFLDFSKTRKWISATAKAEGFEVNELLFSFVSDQELYRINVQHLQHDTFTDIITFDYSDEESIGGEIYISYERVFENAKALNQNKEKELQRIIIHGVLHLLGYGDKAPDEKRIMTAKEDYYLSLQPEI